METGLVVIGTFDKWT